jgi:Ser/Thr protein kinase RdoA (MazF antagonist)
MIDILKLAIEPFGLNPATLTIEKELQPHNWHGDLHYKINVNEKTYSARLLSQKRYEQSAFVEITDDVLKEQIRFCKFLNESGIPFMNHCSTVNDELFTIVRKGDQEWRFVLFEWIKGEHITHCSDIVVEKFGSMAKKIHEISAEFESIIFKRKSHLIGYRQFFQLIKTEFEKSKLNPATRDLIQQYLHLASHHLEKAKTDSLDYIIQSDLNPLNILWNDKEEIIGVVDFESISYTDRIEGLAWLIKWYSRIGGTKSNEMSPALASAFLRGYGEEILSIDDLVRLPSLLWLSGCLNWNFTAKMIELLKGQEEGFIFEFLNQYLRRGKALTGLMDYYPVS